MDKRFSPLKREREIQAVFLERKRFSSKNIILYYKPRLDNNVKVTFFVPKKIFKRAWDRNRTRRILREIFRNYTWTSKGLDIICIVRTLERKMLRFKEIEPLCLPLLKKIV